MNDVMSTEMTLDEFDGCVGAATLDSSVATKMDTCPRKKPSGSCSPEKNQVNKLFDVKKNSRDNCCRQPGARD